MITLPREVLGKKSEATTIPYFVTVVAVMGSSLALPLTPSVPKIFMLYYYHSICLGLALHLQQQ